MMIDRRGLIAGGAALGLAPLAMKTLAQTPLPVAEEDRIRAAAREIRKPLAFANGRFSGAGYDWMLERGRAASFFLFGEEHGIAEVPKLATQLFRELVPAGYGRVAVEISPPMAADIDAALGRGESLKDVFTTPGRQVAFFGMREEAEWLQAARAAVPRNAPAIWGTDYEVGADRRLIALLGEARKPQAAATALARLRDASDAAARQFQLTPKPEYLFPFSGDPALVAAVKAAWPKPEARSAWILDTLQETLEINQLWMKGQGWASNQRRAANLRANLLRHWRSSAQQPKLFMKFGASHMQRGLTGVGTYDMGTLVSELATIEGKTAFHLLVLPGRDTQIASFDPIASTFKPRPAGGGYEKGLERLLDEAFPDVPTLFPTEPLRRLAGTARNNAGPELVRTVNGFDAILVLTGSTPSNNF